MSATAPSPTALRVSSLSQSTPTAFSLRPDAEELARLIEVFDLSALRKLSFEGTLSPVGAADWQLKGRLGATVVQPCVVTLEPVTTRVETQVMRVFVRDLTDADEPEIEMPEDDSVERLGVWIDPAIVMEEELALALPAYPRADGAEAKTVRVTEPGKEAMTDEQARPFAGLAALKQQLGGSEND
ncbi:DUF177 domain-containing protein [Sulfitobacter sp. HNIBRBA2951]|uniref:YceD family protein n=1 Tax=Sulfitobacter aquimarinus TaxID=3158557 RepID=UPI0032DE5D02